MEMYVEVTNELIIPGYEGTVHRAAGRIWGTR
jgi:hypothetical protein